MRRPVVFIAALLVVSILIFDNFAADRPDYIEQFNGSSINVSGRVTDIVKRDDKYYRIQIDNVEMICDKGVYKYKNKLLVNIYDEIEDYRQLLWDKIYVCGKVSLPEKRRNPNTFDYGKYLKSIGIRCIVTANSIEITGEPEAAAALLKSAKCRTIDILTDIMGDNTDIVIGLLFGETEGIDDDVIEVFRRGGTAHILAVSGLHLGILYSFLCRFKKRKRSAIADVIIMACLAAYAALAGFTASVMRATVMIFIHIAGEHLNRRYDLISSACAAMIAILTVNPMQIYNTGFQMSFLAIITLGIMMPVIQKKIKGFLLPVIAAQVGMIPYTMYTFNYISLTSVISNIPLYFIAALIIPVCMAILVFCWLPVIAVPAAAVASVLVRVLLWCNEFTYMGGVFTFDTASPSAVFLVIYYIVGFYICSETGHIAIIRKNYKKIATVVLACVTCAAGISAYFSDGFKKTDMVFVDVGQGDCLHIKAGGKNILIDGGGNFNYNAGKNTLKPYLLKNGVTKIDMAVVTHLHTDHFKGLEELSQVFKIKKLGIYESNSINEDTIKKEFKTDEIIYLKAGDTINISKNVFIEVISPKQGNELDEEDENKNSLVLRVYYNGVKVLMTGDIDANGEKELMKYADMSADILKAAHHGSKYSSSDSFIEAVNPEIAVIQVGKNTYGHPSDEVIGKFQRNNIDVLRNDRNGAIGIKTEPGGKIRIVTMYK